MRQVKKTATEDPSTPAPEEPDYPTFSPKTAEAYPTTTPEGRTGQIVIIQQKVSQK